MTDIFKSNPEAIPNQKYIKYELKIFTKNNNSSTFGSFSTRSEKTDDLKKIRKESEAKEANELLVEKEPHKSETSQIEPVDGEEKKKKIKRKRRKNPMAPKQPLSAYNLFVKDNLRRYKERYPNFNQKTLLKQIAKDWNKHKDKSAYKMRAAEYKAEYERKKDHVKLYHKPHGVKKPENAFILFMQERTKAINEAEINNTDFWSLSKEMSPKKPKKPKKPKQKTVLNVVVEPRQQNGILLNVKTGENYENADEQDERSQSDYRSTNPTSMAVSSIATEWNESVVNEKFDEKPSSDPQTKPDQSFLVPLPKPSKSKAKRTTQIAEIAKEWKGLSEEEKKPFKEKAKTLMDNYKLTKRSKLRELYKKAIENRKNAQGIVKRQRSAYNYYIQELLTKKWATVKQNGEKLLSKEMFKIIASQWKDTENMTRYNKLHIKDGRRFESDIERYYWAYDNEDQTLNEDVQVHNIENQHPEKMTFDLSQFPTIRNNIVNQEDMEINEAEANDILYELLPLNEEQIVEEEIRREYEKQDMEYKENSESDIEVDK